MFYVNEQRFAGRELCMMMLISLTQVKLNKFKQDKQLE